MRKILWLKASEKKEIRRMPFSHSHSAQNETHEKGGKSHAFIIRVASKRPSWASAWLVYVKTCRLPVSSFRKWLLAQQQPTTTGMLLSLFCRRHFIKGRICVVSKRGASGFCLLQIWNLVCVTTMENWSWLPVSFSMNNQNYVGPK